MTQHSDQEKEVKINEFCNDITLRKHLLGVIDHRFHTLMKGCQCCTVVCVFLTAIIHHHYSLLMVEVVVLVVSRSSSGGGSRSSGVGGNSR